MNDPDVTDTPARSGHRSGGLPGRRAVRFEQAVYGSFAFRGGGYAVLARSPGCRDEWVAELRAACQAIGERPAGVPDAPGLLSLVLPCGIRAVIGMSPQGDDDRGRPGALAFHALFLSPREYRKAGADPFALAPALRSEWSGSDTPLPSGTVAVPRPGPAPDAPPADPRTAPVAAALLRRRRVLIEAEGPIDGLAREVWARLPARVRGRLSLATWAFGNAHRFDLAAVPRRAGVVADATYVDILPAEAPGRTGFVAAPTVAADGLSRRRLMLSALAAAGLGGAAVGLGLRAFGPSADAPPVAAPRPEPPAAPTPERPEPGPGPPSRADVPPAPGDDDPAERRRVAELLTDLADRCGLSPDPAAAGDPAALLDRLSTGLRYRGPLLDGGDRAALRADAHRDAGLALDWDRIVRRFAGDRPLPADFRDGPLRWQIAVVGWSWHADPGRFDRPGRSASELTQDLAELPTVGVSLRPTLLSARHPALASYLDFLGGLPRR